MKYLLIHTLRRPDDGAFIRVKNLNSKIAEVIKADCREVVLLSVRYLIKGLFLSNTNNRIFQKRVILPVLWTDYHFFGRIWNRVCSWIIGIILAVVFRPGIVTGETPRSWMVAHIVKKLRPNCRLVMDLHGVIPEEILFHYPPSGWRDGLVRWETKRELDIVENADFIICQSEKMVEHLRQKYPNIGSVFHAFQCVVRLESFFFDSGMRRKIRQKLELKENETLFVYCGSFDRWQNINYSIEIFAEYQKTHFAGSVTFLIISPNPGTELLKYGNVLGLKKQKIRIIKVPHEEVPGYLNAADIGFLIRDDCLVNCVASPTKLGEYLACGLPVVVGNVAHSWPPTTIDSSCFCFVDLNNSKDAANSIQRFLKFWRQDVDQSRFNAVSLAERALSSEKETIKLRAFMSNSGLITVNKGR